MDKNQPLKVKPNSPSILQSGNFLLNEEEPDPFEELRLNMTMAENFTSVNLTLDSMPLHSKDESFLLIDSEENMKVTSPEQFNHLLNTPNNCKLKVVSIFGNSGDGKSYALNSILFRNQQKFKTSSSPDGGTHGVWAAFEPKKNLLCLDTPPLHHPNTSTTLLLKVLAVSDVIIYRTRAERLPADLYTFLGQSSQAHRDHFQKVLQSVGHQVELGGPLSTRGPAVIICHEPTHTAPLTTGQTGETPEEQIRNHIQSLGMSIEGLGPLYYTPVPPPLSLQDKVSTVLNDHLRNLATRQYRSPDAVLNALTILSDRIRGRLTCDSPCKACSAKCSKSMGHLKDDTVHHSNKKCRYQHQFENKMYMCRKCNKKAEEVWEPDTQESWLGLARSAWNGYELHCVDCGPIYKSRQYWFGNKTPEEESTVATEIVHVWQGSSSGGSRSGVGVRRALEEVGTLTGALTSCWLADSIAPAYWQPTSQIKECAVCRCALEFGRGELHHCRACGKGVCGSCSRNKRSVPQRGWPDPVRVCNACLENNIDIDDSGDVTARKMGEAVADVLSPLTKAFQYPKDMLTGLARPAYWTPDEEAPSCTGCHTMFGSNSGCTARHHCRRCGQSVCSKCSPHREPVPDRGWDSPVRICNSCFLEMVVTENK